MNLALLLAAAGCGDEPTPGATGEPEEPAGSDGELSLLALNLHCLKTERTRFDDNTARFEAIAAAVANHDVDIIAAQEVCTSATESAPDLLIAALDDVTGRTWSVTSTSAHTAWEGTEDEADEAVAVFTDLPVETTWELEYRVQADLRRVAHAAVLTDGPTIVSVHLDHSDPTARISQARHTASHALAMADPSVDVILAGDFNDRRDSATWFGPQALGFLPDGELDDDRIDHVFAHDGAAWTVSDPTLILTDGEAVSDHPGVLVTLRATTPPATTSTRLIVRSDVGFGRWVTIRGDTDPLSWDLGWTATPIAADEWRLVLTNAPPTFSWKALIDDTTWQAGDDQPGAADTDNETTPTWE